VLKNSISESLNTDFVDAGCIETFTGRLINPLDPDPDDIFIEDIAHSLSLQCRFNGHCANFYSVAEHSVHAAKLAEILFPEKPKIAYFALLHDASEAYLCDIPRPIKSSFTHYLEWEKALSDIIFRKFAKKLPSSEDDEMILKVDNIMLATESFHLTASKGEKWGLSEQPNSNISLFYWSPEEAEIHFQELVDKYR